MNAPALKNISDYKVYLTETMTAWSPPQCLSLAACLAERWLPAYESFSDEEEWGDPAFLQRCLDAVWGHITGRTLTAKDTARYIRQFEDVTPHMDDFDALEALLACGVLTETLRACGDPKHTLAWVCNILLGVLENMVDEWPIGGAEEARVWKSGPVREEVQAQLRLVETVAEVTDFGEGAVRELRNRIGGFKLKSPLSPKPPASPGITNQAVFERYRRNVESDLKADLSERADPGDDPHLLAMAYFGIWLRRYMRRRQIINGEYGRMMDEAGRQALVARNLAHDAAESATPDWHEKSQEMFEMCLSNNSRNNVVDADSVATPHGYGPSLRRLWLEGKRLGQSDAAGWQNIRDWTNHRPAVWESEDERKRKGVAFATPELAELLTRPLAWQSTDDPDHPWATDVDGQRWQVRVNDFPDELMYGLIVAGECVGEFHDWPETWTR